MEKCYMLFNDEKIYIKSNKSSNVAEYTINDAVSYPNVPLYFNIFNNEDVIKDMRTYIKDNEDINSLMQGIFAKKVYLLVPDDVTNVTDIEKRAFDEFAKKLLKGKEVVFGSEFAFVTTFEEKDYVCISRTCRMLILTSIKDKDYKIVSCGLNEKANLKATEVNLMEESIEFILNKDDEKHKFNIDAPGEHSVLNSLLAIGCGVELGVSYDDISEGLKNLARTPMRLEIIRNKEGYVIINDCYNASPQSMKSALEVQNNIKCDKRIAVLGTMLELGDESYLAHKEIGEYAKEIKVDELLVTGDFSKAYKEGFGEDTKVFNTKLELIEYLKANVIIGNSILVKASRSMKFEEIVDAVK